MSHFEDPSTDLGYSFEALNVSKLEQQDIQSNIANKSKKTDVNHVSPSIDEISNRIADIRARSAFRIQQNQSRSSNDLQPQNTIEIDHIPTIASESLAFNLIVSTKSDECFEGSTPQLRAAVSDKTTFNPPRDAPNKIIPEISDHSIEVCGEITLSCSEEHTPIPMCLPTPPPFVSSRDMRRSSTASLNSLSAPKIPLLDLSSLATKTSTDLLSTQHPLPLQERSPLQNSKDFETMNAEIGERDSCVSSSLISSTPTSPSFIKVKLSTKDFVQEHEPSALLASPDAKKRGSSLLKNSLKDILIQTTPDVFRPASSDKSYPSHKLIFSAMSPATSPYSRPRRSSLSPPVSPSSLLANERASRNHALHSAAERAEALHLHFRSDKRFRDTLYQPQTARPTFNRQAANDMKLLNCYIAPNSARCPPSSKSLAQSFGGDGLAGQSNDTNTPTLLLTSRGVSSSLSPVSPLKPPSSDGCRNACGSDVNAPGQTRVPVASQKRGEDELPSPPDSPRPLPSLLIVASDIQTAVSCQLDAWVEQVRHWMTDECGKLQTTSKRRRFLKFVIDSPYLFLFHFLLSATIIIFYFSFIMELQKNKMTTLNAILTLQASIASIPNGPNLLADLSRLSPTYKHLESSFEGGDLSNIAFREPLLPEMIMQKPAETLEYLVAHLPKLYASFPTSDLHAVDGSSSSLKSSIRLPSIKSLTSPLSTFVHETKSFLLDFLPPADLPIVFLMRVVRTLLGGIAWIVVTVSDVLIFPIMISLINRFVSMLWGIMLIAVIAGGLWWYAQSNLLLTGGSSAMEVHDKQNNSTNNKKESGISKGLRRKSGITRVGLKRRHPTPASSSFLDDEQEDDLGSSKLRRRRSSKEPETQPDVSEREDEDEESSEDSVKARRSQGQATLSSGAVFLKKVALYFLENSVREGGVARNK
eukprot:GDKJ01029436.1.p1 GENE.GDKJ01029436.1~~GDKJ01029436.1.p1  ORF type:complete len:927 (+),score=190.35 GDKJ01029436.1:48-2828(+)